MFSFYGVITIFVQFVKNGTYVFDYNDHAGTICETEWRRHGDN